MSRTFKFNKNPHNEEINIYSTDTFTFNPGVTVLVGCNGAGKTTLLKNIDNQLKKDKNCLLVKFDNLKQGGSTSMEFAALSRDMQLFAELLRSSEGENIYNNICNISGYIGNIVHQNAMNTKDLFILFDAIDSGLSIDNIVEIKEDLFNLILNDTLNQNRNVYIICSANEYELCNNENCFDVYKGEYIKFKNYNEYRDFILQSKKIKNKRWK